MLLLTQSAALAQRAPNPDPEASIERDLAELEAAFYEVRSAKVSLESRDKLLQIKMRMTEREIPPTTQVAQRKQFSRAWKLMAAIEREIRGDTEEVLETYRIANGLDPEDKEIERELRYRQQKWDAVHERLEEARKLREARGIELWDGGLKQ